MKAHVGFHDLAEKMRKRNFPTAGIQKINELNPRFARREAESRVCRDRGDDELISASLGGVGLWP